MRRALKSLGETDLYFYKIENTVLTDIAILENKDIDFFDEQYFQLMGYLNQSFQFGITLSINRKYSLKKARDKLIDSLKAITGDFAITSLMQSNENMNHFVSEHIVPETGKPMKVHHLIINLNDESRITAAKTARKR